LGAGATIFNKSADCEQRHIYNNGGTMQPIRRRSRNHEFHQTSTADKWCIYKTTRHSRGALDGVTTAFGWQRDSGEVLMNKGAIVSVGRQWLKSGQRHDAVFDLDRLIMLRLPNDAARKRLRWGGQSSHASMRVNGIVSQQGCHSQRAGGGCTNLRTNLPRVAPPSYANGGREVA